MSFVSSVDGVWLDAYTCTECGAETMRLPDDGICQRCLHNVVDDARWDELPQAVLDEIVEWSAEPGVTPEQLESRFLAARKEHVK